VSATRLGEVVDVVPTLGSAPGTAALTKRRDYARREVPRGPAPAGLRACAAIVDLGVTALPAALGAMVVYSLRDDNGGGEADRLVFAVVAALVTLSVFVWNFGFKQGRTGHTVGKEWCGLLARRAGTGAPLGGRRSLLHQLTKPADYLSIAGGLRPLWNGTGRTFANQLHQVEVVRRATALDEGFTPTARNITLRAMRTRRLIGLAVLLILLATVLLASIAVGARPMTMAEISHAVFPSTGLNWEDAQRILTDPVTGLSVVTAKIKAAYSISTGVDTDIIVRSLRVPRALIGLSVGIALGVAGALIQGHTRNPLADPGILGVSAGAACAVVIAIFLFRIADPIGYVWFAFAGAAIASVLVFGLSSIGGGTASPLSLVLGGSAVAAFLSSITSAIVLLDQTTLDSFRFWVVGSVAGRGLNVLWAVLPFLVVGLLIALASTPGLNLLTLGEDVARALGANIAANRVVGIIAITLLTGAATAACGPIGFVGLVVPHLARAVTGPDYRWLVPYAGLVGGILLVLCDVIGRVLVRPGELQVGLVLALVGAPFFIALVRRRKLATL
jgi:iron complex transport system permease protein